MVAILPACDMAVLSCMILAGQETILVARDAALRRPHTNMVTERSASPAWGEQPSILARLREWSAQHPLRPVDGSPPALCSPDEIPILWAQASSPDEPYRPPSFALRRAEDVEASLAEAVVAALEQAAAAEDDPALEEAREQLYAAALDTTRATVKLVLAQLVTRGIKPVTVRPQARWLLEQATHGEALLLAIALSFTSREPSTHAELAILARHSQFWRIATGLLDARGVGTLDFKWAWLSWSACGYPDHESDAFTDRLAPQLATRPDIRAWILRVDCANAAARARAGDLAGALAAASVDDELLNGACQIIGLLLHFPYTRFSAEIETYPDAALAVDRLVRLLLDRCDTVQRLRTAQDILAWLECPTDIVLPKRLRYAEAPAEEEAARWQRREALGWTEDVRATLADDCARILRRSRSRQIVQDAATQSSGSVLKDRLAQHVAWIVAPSVGLDFWGEGFERLVQHPFDDKLCGQLLETDDPALAEKVVHLIAGLLPDPTQNGGLRRLPEERERVAIAMAARLSGAMRRLHLYNERIVVFALSQNECYVRDNVVLLLESRPVEQWSDAVADALRHAAAAGGCDHTRTRLKKLRARLDASTAG